MNRITSAAVIAVFALLLCPPTSTAVDTEGLRRKQHAQEKARGLARELVSGILQIQTRQLKENGLEQLPIYEEIHGMSTNIDDLVQEEMQDVVQLLVKAQEGTNDERLANFNLARNKIREVVIALMAERQKLLRRLQIARIASQVRQLITMETRAMNVTKSLPERTDGEREQAALSAIEGQRDAKSLFLVLVETLVDVSTWGGHVGAGASDGLRILKAAQVGLELDNAGKFLEASQFEEATRSQKAVIKGLRALLEKIEETRGLISSDREEALRMVREMLEKQEKLREEARDTEQFTEDAVEELVEKQGQIHKSLGDLAEMLDQFPATEPLLETAKAAAYEATAQLFEENKDQAVDEQTTVIGSLAEIEEQLKHAIDQELSDRSAEELAQRVEQLGELKKTLEELAEQQSRITEEAAEKPAEAQQQEQQVAEALADATEAAMEETEDLPGVIESRLTDAEEAVAEAVEAMQDASPEQAEARQDAAANAEDAIERALAETEAQLADTKRRQMAVEIGELARAAEALERAAASEWGIADAATDAAEAEGFSEGQAQGLAQEQGTVEEVAEKIAEGVEAAVPAVAEKLQEAAKPMGDVGQKLEAARQAPGESSKPMAAQVAETARQVAESLEQAARALRREFGETAEDLVVLADEQLEQVAQVQTPVEQAMAEAGDDRSETLERLEEALNTVQEAQTEQQRAAGRAAAAEAAEIVQQVSDAAVQQAEAARAAEALAQGKANTPLDAATKQQAVAEQAAEMAKAADSNIGKALKEAAAAAAEAARETLNGNPNKAEAAREAAADILARAQEAADQAAAEATEAPAGQPDAEAQARVGEKSAQAAELAQDPVPEAAKTLGEARQQSEAAEDAIRSGDTEQTGQAQKATGETLERAEDQFQQAIEQLADNQGERLAEQAAEAGELAETAADVSPDASAALRSAESAAEQGAERAADSPDEAMAAGQEVQRAMERAAASLAAREQQIGRDREIADAIGELAKEQQEARDEIARQADALEQLAQEDMADDAVPTGDEGPAAEQMAAAEALQLATQEFAHAQRATGQGAVEISGQEEVANQPIREGLEAASELALGIDEAMGETPATNEEPGVALGPTIDEAPPAGESMPSAEGQPAAQGEPSDQGQPAGVGEPTGEGQMPAQGQSPGPVSPSATELGTGFVPNSPDVTAQQIAGAEALAQAAQALAQGQSQSQTPGEAQVTGQAAAGEPKPGPTSAMASDGGVSLGGDSSNNQLAPSESLQLQPDAQGDSRTANSDQDAEMKALRFTEEPWFAKLPPTLREAIQARARRRAPRGYEERMRRYFESTD